MVKRKPLENENKKEEEKRRAEHVRQVKFDKYVLQRFNKLE